MDPGEGTTRSEVYNTKYDQVVIFDHLLKKKGLTIPAAA